MSASNAVLLGDLRPGVIRVGRRASFIGTSSFFTRLDDLWKPVVKRRYPELMSMSDK